MKSFLGLVLACVLLLQFCERTEALNPCSAGKMVQAYNEMKRVNCRNCDKYFHCQGNYEAVHHCRGILQTFTAETLSNARELFGGASSSSGSNYGSGSGSGNADSAADQVANRFGRSGGNCAGSYLASAGCAYNPRTRQCKW